MAFQVENLETTLADLRARGVTFERFDVSGFDVRADTIPAPDNYPSRGTGELGAFVFDSEGNLIGIAHPIRETPRRSRSFRPNPSDRGSRPSFSHEGNLRPTERATRYADSRIS